uniref:Uncharacterized protein LOC104227280 n=1 Tax=Nicotiana sylvestris TaxID=4096 RepID=A0A1U7WU93_NICSY|nr:PREDICTED: uncharacterized protein LOC104227280 [Nicotiana sylvestris]
MNLRIIEHFLLMLFLCLSYDEVRGITLPNQEDLELEKRLKLLNKPAIKIIKTKYGDIYDCVDFYKQPAFDHPLLKNRNYYPQMKPSSYMKESDSTISTSKMFPRTELPDGGCPVGTVPVRRTTKEDLIRHKLLPPPEDVMVNSSLTHIWSVLLVEVPGASRDRIGGSADAAIGSHKRPEEVRLGLLERKGNRRSGNRISGLGTQKRFLRLKRVSTRIDGRFCTRGGRFARKAQGELGFWPCYVEMKYAPCDERGDVTAGDSDLVHPN